MGPNVRGFQFLLILDLCGISFHAVVVIGLGKDLLFKPVLGHCDIVHTLTKHIPMYVPTKYSHT